MNFKTLTDTPCVVRETQIGRDAAERLRKDGERAAIVIAPAVARPLGRWHAAFNPVRAQVGQLNAKVTVTATQIPPPDFIQGEWASPQGFSSSGDHFDSATAPAASAKAAQAA